MEKRMRFDRPHHYAIGRTAARIVAAVIIGTLITACTGWPGPYGSRAHLKNNPFDRAISSSNYNRANNARRGLLKRFPTGSPTADLRRYLKSIGASCAPRAAGPTTCRYSQFEFVGNRGAIGDESRSYTYHDFTTQVWSGQATIAKLTVCQTVTTEHQRGPMILGGHHYLRKSKFKPCGNKSTRQRACNGEADAY